VALKIFHDWLTPQSIARIRAAHRTVARLHDPNLLLVYDCGEHDGLLHVAEELIEGVTLEEKIAGVPQPPLEAARLVATLAGALHYAHMQGLVHRNLKPRVVLLAPHGTVKISSFELAKLLKECGLFE
jgi:serine/threonine protein kinase